MAPDIDPRHPPMLGNLEFGPPDPKPGLGAGGYGAMRFPQGRATGIPKMHSTDTCKWNEWGLALLADARKRLADHPSSIILLTHGRQTHRLDPQTRSRARSAPGDRHQR